ncbi:TrkH family potassium uptake protein [Dehalococcoidia bacterium]|nr:TrkH family potassium uptake protein [Dehalococcoidia bacterium]
MRFKPVFHYLGMVLTILGLSMLLPLAFALYYGGGDSLAFVLSLVATISTGLILWRLIPRDKEGISRREALFLVALIWVVASAFSALPFWLSGAIECFLDAYFEAVSGLTTTGATVLTSIETQPQGLLLWRSLIQWLGGMGIVMLFVAMFPILGIGAAHLFEAEIPGPQVERLTARIRDTAKILWQVYLGLSLLQALLLLLAGVSPFEALVTTFSTMPTGGFLHLDLSIGAYDCLLIEGIVALFMMAAGVNFGLYYYLLWRHQPQRFFANVELRAYFAFLFGAILFVGIDLVRNMGLSVGEALRYAGFQSISIMTTTGFTTADFTAWPEFSRAVLLALMLIGASAGSTGGGLKVIRVLVLVKLAYRQILLAFNPRAVIPLNLGGGTLPSGIVTRIAGFAILYFTILVGAFLIMSAVGLDQTTALSSVLATLGNVGPGMGLVGPAENYLFIPAAGKLTLIVCMLVGRLELFTFLALFSPSFWKWR